MNAKAALTTVMVMGLLAFGCDNASPTAPEDPQVLQPSFASVSGQQASATAQTISGMSYFIGGTDGWEHVTPGDIIHTGGGTAVTEYTGDIVGIVTFFYKQSHSAADGSHLVSKGPFEGEVTWNGRTGMMAGMFTTECKPDSGVPYSCGGTMIGHGSGDLEGVKFHINWGPGWWPFPYEGFALDPHGG